MRGRLTQTSSTTSVPSLQARIGTPRPPTACAWPAGRAKMVRVGFLDAAPPAGRKAGALGSSRLAVPARAGRQALERHGRRASRRLRAARTGPGGASDTLSPRRVPRDRGEGARADRRARTGDRVGAPDARLDVRLPGVRDDELRDAERRAQPGDRVRTSGLHLGASASSRGRGRGVARLRGACGPGRRPRRAHDGPPHGPLADGGDDDGPRPPCDGRDRVPRTVVPRALCAHAAASPLRPAGDASHSDGGGARLSADRCEPDRAPSRHRAVHARSSTR